MYLYRGVLYRGFIALGRPVLRDICASLHGKPLLRGIPTSRSYEPVLRDAPTNREWYPRQSLPMSYREVVMAVGR